MSEEAQHRHWWKRCAHGGDRIGTDEPVLVEHPDGRMRTAYRNLDPHQRIGPWQFFHPHCVVAGGGPATTRESLVPRSGEIASFMESALGPMEIRWR
jgi:hypothetical protein